MAHIQFRAEFEKGRSVEFIPKLIKPLTLADLWATLKDEVPSFRLNFFADNPIVDGSQQTGNASIKTSITFNETPSPFALVQGGWLPVPLVIPQQFLVDRNVVAQLKKIKNTGKAERLRAFQWWMQFFSEGKATFNPLPYAWEGGRQKTPSFSEFVSSFDEGVSEIREALPNANVITYGPTEYRQVYQMIQDFEPRAAGEVSFLCAVCPLFANRVSRSNEKKLLDAVTSEARKNALNLNSLAFISALSCIYDDLQGETYSIGRRLLKPKPLYRPTDAFNALSDLRHIELAVAGQVYFGDEAFSLTTCDHALASLWCALLPRGTHADGREIELTFDLTEELFPRLSLDEIKKVNSLIQK